MDYRIVPIAEDHIEGFRAVLDSVARERRYLSFLEAPPPDEVGAFVLDNIRKGHPQLVALVEGHVVGWCDILPINRPTQAHSGILGVGISSEYRGRGIGPALVLAALANAKAAGFARVELTVRESNRPALALYERFGFAHEGVKRNAVRVDGKYENLLCMALLLDEAG
jgi:ribosomal protein S18 acetylase RimI-like enzyme